MRDGERGGHQVAKYGDQANGAAAFQSVPHFHLHLIPRWTNDGKGFDWKLVPGNRDEILSAADKIRAMFG